MNTRKSNQELINSKEYRLKSPPTQNLKLPPFLLQNHSSFRSVLAKISVIKQVKSRFFYPFTPWGLSVFKPRTCILHHLAFLVWLPAHYFLRPTTHFQPLKTHFLTTISPFSAMFFMVRKGFIYTIAMYFYAFHLAFSTILPCIQHHFTLRFAPFYLAFCSKTRCIQQHIALHFGANSPKSGTSCVFMQRKSIFNHSHATPISHRNKPSRELKICGLMSDCWQKLHSQC